METGPKYVFLAFVVLVIGVLVAIGLHQRNTTPPEPPIKGAGSTFIDPLMVHWSSYYEQTEAGLKVGYQSFGSSSGIKFFLEKKVDFACSEAPLTDEQMAKIGANGDKALHIPVALGAVAPVYNLPALKRPLQFTGALLADIYLGKVKQWNDKGLADLNPEVALPNENIVAVHRSDGSGTTFIWTDYLSKVHAEWKEKIGAGTEIQWPAGIAAPGNQGVAPKVRDTPGSIGYAELTYAYRLDLAQGLVRNHEGEFIKASLPSVIRAADSALATIPEDLRYSLTDARGKGTYPIVGTTWFILRQRQPAGKGRQLSDFLTWAVGNGQVYLETLLYAKLPEVLAERANKRINEIELEK